MGKILQSLKNSYALDLRALALMRFLLGSYVFTMAIRAIVYADVFFSDVGVFPRTFSIGAQGLEPYFSVFLLSGDRNFSILLFSIMAAAALSFAVGYRTKLASFLCWLFLMSEYQRTPIMFHGGEVYLIMIFFWMMFLPMGARYSVDELQSRGTKLLSDSFSSLACFGLLFQIAALYSFSTGHKTGAEWVENYTALYYALSNEVFSTEFGRWLLQFPELLKVMTVGVLVVEFSAFIWFLSPIASRWMRTVGVILFISFHIGLIFTMQLESFPYICIMVLIGVIHPAIFFKKSEVRISEEAPTFSFRLSPRLLPQAFMAMSILAILFSNMAATKFIDRSPWIFSYWEDAFYLRQRWGMFAPWPLKTVGWLKVESHLANAEVVDIFREGGPVLDSRPTDLRGSLKSDLWLKFMEYGETEEKTGLLEEFSKYLCANWNQSHEGEMIARDVTVSWIRQWTPRPGEPENEPQVFATANRFCTTQIKDGFENVSLEREGRSESQPF